MSLLPCSRQPEVARMVASGHWPHACPPELRAHLQLCRSCAELVTLNHAFQQARADSLPRAVLPAPGAIWWRAQLRRRHAAIERVARPMFGAYVFALSVVLLVAVLFAVTQAKQGLRWIQALEQSGTAALHLDALDPSVWLSSAGMLGILIPVLASVAILGAVLVYFSLERQ